MKKSIIAIGIVILFIGTSAFANATNGAKTYQPPKEPLPIQRTYWLFAELSGNILIESYGASREIKNIGWININITGVVKEQPNSGHTGFFIGFGWPGPQFHPFATRIPDGTCINLRISVLSTSFCTNFTVGEICGFAWNDAINVHLKYV